MYDGVIFDFFMSLLESSVKPMCKILYFSVFNFALKIADKIGFPVSGAC